MTADLKELQSTLDRNRNEPKDLPLEIPSGTKTGPSIGQLDPGLTADQACHLA